MAGIWSVQRIKDTARRAQRGDLKALESLQKYNNQQAVNANKRIARFEKAGESSPALALATAYTKRAGHGSRFTRSKKISINELERQLLELRKFNTSATGSISGWRKYREESLSRLEKQLGIVIPKDKISMVEDYLESELFHEYKQFDSERALEEGILSIISNVPPERYQQAWEDYQSGQLDLEEAFEEFVQINQDDIENLQFT